MIIGPRYTGHWHFGTSTGLPADSTTYYAQWNGGLLTTSGNRSYFFVPCAGYVDGFVIYPATNNGSASTEDVTHTLLKNGVTTGMSLVTPWSSGVYPKLCTGSDVPVNIGDYLQLQIATPAWTTNPSGINFSWGYRIRGTKSR